VWRLLAQHLPASLNQTFPQKLAGEMRLPLQDAPKFKDNRFHPISAACRPLANRMGPCMAAKVNPPLLQCIAPAFKTYHTKQACTAELWCNLLGVVPRSPALMRLPC
jgi:hypothetical protein